MVVTPEEENLRLDQFLATATGLSRRLARTLIADGTVHLNTRPKRVLSHRVIAGDVVDLCADEVGPDVSARPQPAAVELLHEDRWLVSVNKPAGVLSQPVRRGGSRELAQDQRLLLMLAHREGQRPFLRLVHRLDRLTSGALLFARNREALAPLTRAWAAGEVTRIYLAVVEGTPTFAGAELVDRLARDPDHAWRFRVSDHGQEARTTVSVLRGVDPDLAVVACRLDTGRTHQVRVQLAAVGHPIAGDRLYGARRTGVAARPLLHAALLRLPHPRSREPLCLTAPPPDDLQTHLPQNELELEELLEL
jgi:23S rRNA pseudouridine1911/1915/1917 synthase